MEARELNIEEKKACIVFIIALLNNDIEEFICQCFSEFVEAETEMVVSQRDRFENHMHIIFPELYKELSSLIIDDTDMLRYNKNNTRMGEYFEERYKSPVWFHGEREERIHFLNDLNESFN